VVRLYRELAGLDGDREDAYALEFEEPALITLGFGYEKRPRLSAARTSRCCAKSTNGRRCRWRREWPSASAALAWCSIWTTPSAKPWRSSKARGFKSPYLRTFVVARINPLRFIKGRAAAARRAFAVDDQAGQGINPDKNPPEDVARTGGPPPRGRGVTGAARSRYRRGLSSVGAFRALPQARYGSCLCIDGLQRGRFA